MYPQRPLDRDLGCMNRLPCGSQIYGISVLSKRGSQDNATVSLTAKSESHHQGVLLKYKWYINVTNVHVCLVVIFSILLLPFYILRHLVRLLG